jgi:hypothetical protein
VKKKLIIFVAMNLFGGLSGCAPSRSNDIAVPDRQIAAAEAAVADEPEQSPEVQHNRQHIPPQTPVTPVTPVTVDRLEQAASLDQKPSVAPPVAPAVHSAPVEKVALAPVAAPKAGVIVPQEVNTEIKPADMKVANAFDRDPYLSSQVKPLLPRRSTVAGAAAGFKNQKQFISAMHLSRNLNIPFDQIKTRMTGDHRMSLHDAVREIRPEMTKNELKAEVNKAEKQAKDDENQAKDDEKQAKDEAKRAAAQDRLANN